MPMRAAENNVVERREISISHDAGIASTPSASHSATSDVPWNLELRWVWLRADVSSHHNDCAPCRVEGWGRVEGWICRFQGSAGAFVTQEGLMASIVATTSRSIVLASTAFRQCPVEQNSAIGRTGSCTLALMIT